MPTSMEERELHVPGEQPLIGWRLFRVRRWESGFVLAGAGLLSGGGCARTEQLLARHQHTPLTFSNGDFYLRNLIVRPDGRIVIVNWEAYNTHSPFHTISHPRT